MSAKFPQTYHLDLYHLKYCNGLISDNLSIKDLVLSLTVGIHYLKDRKTGNTEDSTIISPKSSLFFKISGTYFLVEGEVPCIDRWMERPSFKKSTKLKKNEDLEGKKNATMFYKCYGITGCYEYKGCRLWKKRRQSLLVDNKLSYCYHKNNSFAGKPIVLDNRYFACVLTIFLTLSWILLVYYEWVSRTIFFCFFSRYCSDFPSQM